MRPRSWTRAFLLLPLFAFTGAAAPSRPDPVAPPGSHTWDFTEVFSNADGTIQFIELRECCGGPSETGLPGHILSSNAHSFAIPGVALTPPTSNKHYLLGTAAYAALPGAPAPDAIIPAGSLPFFFSPGGDTLSYVPWDTWTLPSVPTDGVNSLLRNGTTGPNSPTNYAGVTGSVNAAPAVPAMSVRSVVVLAVLSVLALSAVLFRRTT